MNRKGQEIEPGPAIMAVIGGFAAFVMAKRMDIGVIMTLITGIGTAIVSYFIALWIANS